MKKAKRRKRKSIKNSLLSKVERRVDTQTAATYLLEYVLLYRDYFYNIFSAPPPRGAGYPRVAISPYLYSDDITCYLARDGAVIEFENKSEENLARIINSAELDSSAFSLPEPKQVVNKRKIQNKLTTPTTEPFNSEFNLTVFSYNISLEELVFYRSFGGLITLFQNRKIISGLSRFFWDPIIVRNLIVEAQNAALRRSFDYFEILFHMDEGAWDRRNLRVRTLSDIRRDYLLALGEDKKNQGRIIFGSNAVSVLYERLIVLERAITSFEKLLDENPKGNESLFHDFLKDNTVLLDVYGKAFSKPKLYYPEGESPLGKKYVEPDFIIKYPGNKYKLIELEKPGKSIATLQGQPRSEVNQSTFQIAEWDAYIRNHYDQLKSLFPGISVHRTSMVVISRTTENNFGAGRDIKKYMELIGRQYRVDDIFTYDDLLERAKQVYTKLSTLNTQINQ